MIFSSDEFINLRNSTDPDEQQRAAIDCADVKVWLDIVNNYPDMRFWVAINKTVPIDILVILSNDDDPKVRLTVAMKRKLNRCLFNRLSRDKDESVRNRIACNKKTPVDILELLASDSSGIVRNSALNQLSRRAGK